MLTQNIQEDPTLKSPVESAGSIDIHTMPEKFLSMRPSFKLGKSGKKRTKKPMTLKKNLTLGLLAILVLGALMVLAAWLFLKSVNQSGSDSSPAEYSPADSQMPMSDTSTPQSTSSPPAELPTQDENLLNFDQWLSFESPAYNYELKYPPTWQIEENNNPSPANTLYLVRLKDESNLDHFSLTIFSNPSQVSLLEWLQDNFDIDRIDLESFNLQGYSAYQYEDILGKLDIVYILFNQKVYQLAFSKTESNILNQVYTQILINFKLESGTETSPDEQPLDLTPAVDTDNDNLTDLEEELYATDKNQSDTDGDSYSDGDEVANLYHPGIAGAARIYTSELVSTYINNTYNYNLIYPSTWSVKGRDDSIIFQDKAGEFIQVLITPNDQGFTDIRSWYQAVINPDSSSLTNTTLADQAAIRTANGTQLYFLLGDNIYSLIYNMGLRAEPNFMTTFNMIIKSFRLMAAGN